MKNQKKSSVPLGNALCTFSPSLLNMPIHSPSSQKFSPKIEAVPVGPVAGMETRDFCSMWRNRACEQMTWSKAKDMSAPTPTPRPRVHGCISSLWCVSWASNLINRVRTCSFGLMELHCKKCSSAFETMSVSCVFPLFFFFN